MPLQIIYRPSTLDDFAGNRELKEGLSSILARPDKPHAYLFSGPSGTGKTTIARILAKALGCEDVDLYEYNTANLRGIDSVREMIEQSRLSPKGPCKFYILDEVHQQTHAAQEAMLKMLEEAPKNCYYVLATTNPEKLLPTIKTRVTSFAVMPLTNGEMETLLNTVAKEMSLVIAAEVFAKIISVSDGCAREALKLLDQVRSLPNVESQLELIKRTSFGGVEIVEICRRMYKPDSGFAKWVEIREMLKSIDDNDSERVRVAIFRYLGKVLLNVKSGQGMLWILQLQEEFKKPVFNVGRAELDNQFCNACMVTFPK